jgi:biopolymer transport protein ExbB
MPHTIVSRRTTFRFLGAAAAATALVLLLHGTGFGQDTPAVPPPAANHPAKVSGATPVSAAEPSVTFADIFNKGGGTMWLQAAMSVLAVAFAIYGFFMLREEQVIPRHLRRELLARLRAGSLREARAACGQSPCALSEITLAALDYLETEEISAPMLKDLVEGEGMRQAVAIQQKAQYLLDIGVIAPMVGLLGTVFGMIRAFNVIAFDIAKAKPVLLANGVAEALINTAAGLIVGIPAMMLHSYFRARANKLIARLETTSTEVLTLILRKVHP